MADVVALLGDPDVQGEKWGEDYFEYRIPDRGAHHYNRIYLRGKVVSWMDVEKQVDKE